MFASSRSFQHLFTGRSLQGRGHGGEGGRSSRTCPEVLSKSVSGSLRENCDPLLKFAARLPRMQGAVRLAELLAYLCTFVSKGKRDRGRTPDCTSGREENGARSSYPPVATSRASDRVLAAASSSSACF